MTAQLYAPGVSGSPSSNSVSRLTFSIRRTRGRAGLRCRWPAVCRGRRGAYARVRSSRAEPLRRAGPRRRVSGVPPPRFTP